MFLEVTKVHQQTTIMVISLVATFCTTCSSSLSRAIINDCLEIQVHICSTKKEPTTYIYTVRFGFKTIFIFPKDLNKTRLLLSTLYACALVLATLDINPPIDLYYKIGSFINITLGMIFGTFVMFKIWFKFNKHPTAHLTVNRT